MGFTALALACAHGHNSVAQCLREAGATGETPSLPPPATCCMLTFCSVGFPETPSLHGQVYYELELARVGPTPQIGWATTGFAPDERMGVGNDACSWGADGVHSKLWHDGTNQEWSVRWEDGDVVGCAADLEQGTLWFGRNGEWSVTFEGCSAEWSAGVFPAISGQAMAFAINGAPRFPGPSPQFKSIVAPGEWPQKLLEDGICVGSYLQADGRSFEEGEEGEDEGEEGEEF